MTNVIDESIKAGEIITADHVKSIRPGYGVAPKYLDNIIGKVVKNDIHRGSPVGDELL